MEPYELALKIAHILDKKKLEDLEIVEVKELTTLTDYFVIAICSNTRQSMAISEELEYLLEEENIAAKHSEGYETARWILLDYLGVIVHILYKEDAQIYGLHRLWQDGKNIPF
ncbi:ribosome silencing factor [Candidatus Epulonipiscium viviparus]|uniref:ribosome silencing factor n=1 Tax=Candidatus Epulonipiscium viviparus TaxID=420336 RepID=UPI00016BFDBE|nr:ribosome silencing factor [Candidatus Epulopiscium viviparus]